MTLTAARRAALLATIADPDALEAEIDGARREYFDGLPDVAMSRCPFTGDVVSRTIDNFGLDGPWWAYDDIQRGFPLFPDSVWTFSGAMRLDDAVEETDFLVKPGPAVPYVLQHLIRHPAITAVVSTVPIGAHTGYAIVYFLDDDEGPVHLTRSNDWAAPDFWFVDDDGWWNDAIPEGEEERDFDLDRWVANGKLRWIAPGDVDLRLQTDVAHCPYIGLEGGQVPQRVQDGEVWVAPSATTKPRRRVRRRPQDSGSTNTKPPE